MNKEYMHMYVCGGVHYGEAEDVVSVERGSCIKCEVCGGVHNGG